MRTSTIDAIIATISYLSVSGIVTCEYAEHEARAMRAFMMEYEGFKGNIMDGEVEGSFRAARLHAVGTGLCVGGSLVNVKSVSTVLRIGYLEVLDLYSSLGDELFGLLLCAFGISNGINNPMSETFVCPGAEAIGALPARPRPYESRDEDRPDVFVAGIQTKDFALAPCFSCRHCVQHRYTREKEAIGQRIASGDSVSDAQRERHQKNSSQVTKLKRKADRGAKLSSDEQKLVDARKQKNAKARPKAKQRARQKAKQKALANHEKCAQPTVDAILTHFANKSPNFIADKLSNNVSLARVMKHNNYTESQSKNAIFQEDLRNKVSAALIISNKPAKRTWRCDVCLVEEFDDYDKAVAHEEACKCKKQLCS